MTTPVDGNGTETGSLRWALAQPGPKWIVFDGDMTITLGAPLSVGSDTTIDGRGNQVLITGHGTGGLSINGVSNVIVEGLEMRDFGDTALTSANNPWDAINVNGSSRVWIDHNTLSEAGDKLIGVQGGSTQVTVSGNHFWDQEQTLQIGDMTDANADIAQTVTVTGNWFDHVGYRQPVVSYGKVHVFNNYMDSWELYAVRSERLAQVYLESNVFQAAGSKKATTTDVGQDCNDTNTNCDDRSGYIYDTGNLYLGKTVTAASSSTDQVFNPHAAYSYTAAPATADLAGQIAGTAGSGPASGNVITLPPPGPVTTTVGVAPTKTTLAITKNGTSRQHQSKNSSAHGKEVRARLKGRKVQCGVALEVKAAGGAGARVTFLRQTASHWVTVGRGHLDKTGHVLVTVFAGTGSGTYLARIASGKKSTGGSSNEIRVV